MEKHVKKIIVAKFEASGIKEDSFGHSGKRQPGNSFLMSLWMALSPFLIESFTMFFVYALQGDSFQTSGLDDFLSCSKDGEIITKTSVREIGNPLTKKGTDLVIVTVVD